VADRTLEQSQQPAWLPASLLGGVVSALAAGLAVVIGLVIWWWSREPSPMGAQGAEAIGLSFGVSLSPAPLAFLLGALGTRLGFSLASGRSLLVGTALAPGMGGLLGGLTGLCGFWLLNLGDTAWTIRSCCCW